jgi:glycerol kinase
MPEHLLALDVGTTGVRAVVVSSDGAVSSAAHRKAALHTPQAGRVEQDCVAILADARIVMDQALTAAELGNDDLIAFGITSQRGNIVLWDATTGAPLTPLVSWQDLRGAARAVELQSLGFAVTHQTPASKLEAVLDGIDDGRQRLQDGNVRWGNIDTFIAWHLCRGAVYAMDESQACTTGYYDYFSGGWNAALLDCQGLAPEHMPTLIDTFGHIGEWRGTPLTALIADQQAAALAQGCTSPGIGKVSYGTSATVDVHSGTTLALIPGAYPLVHWRQGGERRYCLEGMVNTAGAMLDWCAQILQVQSAAALGVLAASTSSTHGVAVLPALQGLGTPYGDAGTSGRIVGLTRATSRADIARAAFEAIAFRVREIDEAVYASADLARPDTLRVDGGIAANDFFLQLQADVVGRPVARPMHLEATAVGAAMAAGIGARAWQVSDIAAHRHSGTTFTPRWSADEREQRFSQWCQALGHRP